MASETYLSGPPAFTSLWPAFPQLSPASRGVREAIVRVMHDVTDVKVLGAAGQTIAGRYVVTMGGGVHRFLKVFENEIRSLQVHSDQVARRCSESGIPVILAMTPDPVAIGDGFSAMLFPFVDARFSDRTVEEVRTVGSLIGKVHRCLEDYPRAREIEIAADGMHARLCATAERILGGWTAHARFQPIALSAARRYIVGLLIRTHAQMVHGDCNYTNFLFDRHTGEPFIIDFEESRSAWLNPLSDLAVATQRFALVDRSNQSPRLAAALIDGYVAASGRQVRTDDLNRAGEEMIARSILLMAEKEAEGIAIPEAEWQKFFDLAEIARATRSLPATGAEATSDEGATREV
ncbi:MAG: phosphotransferase [Gammaproteobacteria bacterium]